jgi:hypothetical protein
MRINYEFDVSDKAAKERNMTSDVDFGVKLHQPIDHHQSFPFRTTMMAHHANHHRPFDNGPTSSYDRNKSLINYSREHIYSVGACGGAVGVRTLQPFDTSESIITTASAFKSPGSIKNSLSLFLSISHRILLAVCLSDFPCSTFKD